jgi:hypothetical protein
MTPTELVQWYKELIEASSKMRTYVGGGGTFYEGTDYHSWLAQACTAIESVFPPDHPVRRNWVQIATGTRVDSSVFHFHKVIGTFRGAFAILEGGKIGSLIDSIRVETENEVLVQAEELLSKNYYAAAAVLAGGALECHLRRLVDKHQISFTGSGSINIYNDAILRANKSASSPIYSNADGSLIKAWGQTRNDAAHQPAVFSSTTTTVIIQAMIDGIRSLMARVP